MSNLTLSLEKILSDLLEMTENQKETCKMYGQML